MKILQFCKKTPIPPKDGESIAIHQLSKTFVNHACDLTIFSLLTPKHKKNKSKAYLENAHYEFEDVDTSISFFAIVKNMINSTKPYIIERFHDISVKRKLVKLLQTNDYDIVQLEGLFLGDYIKYIRKYSSAKIVLRAHNVEHQIWERLAENYSGLKKWYLNKIMIPRLKKFEDKVAREVDMIVTISKLDEIYFKKVAPEKLIHTLPAAYEIKENIKELPNAFNVGFIGGLDWRPNYEGVKWFLKRVWTKFSLKKHTANFNLAGRNFPRKLYDLKNNGLFIFGEIDDAQEFTYQNSVMIAPILSGSGMRIKIIEAMALGRTVVSTTIGAEGIDYTNKENIFIADTPEEWINVLIELSNNKELLEKTGKAAQKLIAKNHDINKLGSELISNYKTLLI